jgi:MYXO-CTERM domain-containing protein
MRWTASALLLAAFPAHAATYEVRPGDDLFAAMEALVAGDELVVHEGVYSTQRESGSWLRSITLEGTSEAPIVVHIAEGAAVRLEGDPARSQNILNLGGSYFTFSGFEMTGGSHGLRLQTLAHATLADLHIHHTGEVGLSANTPASTYDHLTVQGLEIHHTAGHGECMYLGCNDGACTMFNSLVEFNWCHDTTNSSQGDGIELKTGSYGNLIQHNVIVDSHYPGITLYGSDGDPNIVEGNFVINSDDAGIQTVGNAVVRNNVVINAGTYGIFSKASQGFTPSNLYIASNTVVHHSGTDQTACLRANDWTAESTGIVVSNNALYCEGSTAMRLNGGDAFASVTHNVVVGTVDVSAGTSPGAGLNEDFLDPANHVYYPIGAALLETGLPGAVMPSADFDCLLRGDRADVGAYDGTAGAHGGWTLPDGFKWCVEEGDTDEPDTDEPTDTDGPTDTDSPTDTGDGVDDGCSCSTAPSSSSTWLLLLGLATLGARRSRPL